MVAFNTPRDDPAAKAAWIESLAACKCSTSPSVATFAAPPRRLGLQQGPDFVNLRCLADVGPDHCRPLLRQRLDQAFRFEVAQNLAHYRAADAKEIAQCPLDKPFTGLEAEVQDRVILWYTI